VDVDVDVVLSFPPASLAMSGFDRASSKGEEYTDFNLDLSALLIAYLVFVIYCKALFECILAAWCLLLSPLLPLINNPLRI